MEEDGYVVFVISTQSGSTKKQRRLVGFSNGIIKRISLDTLSIEHVFKVQMSSGEKLTCGHYSDNGMNFVFGTNQGSLYIGSMKTIGRNRVEASFCRIENIGRTNSFDDAYKSKSYLKLNNDIVNLNDAESIDITHNGSEDDLADFTGITSIHFPFVDPIGTILVAFDDGTIKVWYSSVRNEQLMKILEMQQAPKKKTPNQPVYYDLSEVGYQQFDLMDSFDLFANPHGLEEVTEINK